MKTRSLVLAWCVLVAIGACKKSSKTANDLPGELKPRPSQVDPAKVDVPPLFAHVPVDTPYLVAALEPVPMEYYAKLKTALGPLLDESVRIWRKQLDAEDLVAPPPPSPARLADPDAIGPDAEQPIVPDPPRRKHSAARLIGAVLDEMDGKWNQAGIESLGLSSKPRFVVYGLGLAPVVARLEIKDSKALLATFERIAKRAGEALPPLETRTVSASGGSPRQRRRSSSHSPDKQLNPAGRADPDGRKCACPLSSGTEKTQDPP